eukprot:642669-Ditylum_brightwellii.AAC.1
MEVSLHGMIHHNLLLKVGMFGAMESVMPISFLDQESVGGNGPQKKQVDKQLPLEPGIGWK